MTAAGALPLLMAKLTPKWPTTESPATPQGLPESHSQHTLCLDLTQAEAGHQGSLGCWTISSRTDGLQDSNETMHVFQQPPVSSERKVASLLLLSTAKPPTHIAEEACHALLPCSVLTITRTPRAARHLQSCHAHLHGVLPKLRYVRLLISTSSTKRASYVVHLSALHVRRLP